MADDKGTDVDNEIPALLLPCVSCNRTFRPEALAVHSKVCEKILIKKRKKFDSFKQRVQGTDLAEYLPVLPTFTKKTESSPVRRQSQPNIATPAASKTPATTKKSKWKDKHNELLQTIHAPSTVVKPSDHERCPHCERSFGPKAFDRHLEWCREQQVRVQPKSPASQRAKERLEARTKYRAPLAGRGRQHRSVSRDKHGSGLREPSHSPVRAPRTPVTTRKKQPYNVTSDSASTPNMNQNLVRGTSLRNSTRTAPATAKKTPQNRMSRFPCPYSSLRLNTEDVNDQVPEMSVIGFGRPEMHLDILDDVDPAPTVPYQLISTYDLDFPDDFVGSSRPSVRRENQCPEMTPVLPQSPLRSVEVNDLELNKTYSEDDLKELLDCNMVKGAVKTQKKNVKKVRTAKVKQSMNVEIPDLNGTGLGCTGMYKDIEPKTEYSGCDMYEDLSTNNSLEKLLDQSNEINRNYPPKKTKNEVNTIDLTDKPTIEYIPKCKKPSKLVQYVTQVQIVPNASCFVLEVEKLSSCNPELSSCKSYSIYSQSYLPKSFNQLTLEFPGVNLIRDSDLIRNYVFFHVILQRLNDDHDLGPMAEAFGFQNGCGTYGYGSNPDRKLIDKRNSSCFTFSGCCSKDSLIQKPEMNIDCDRKSLCSPNKSKRKSKVRSSRTFTKVIHNWWGPTPPKKIKRYLSPDSLTTEKSVTSDSETYWDYYDIDKNCESSAIKSRDSFVDFEKAKKTYTPRPDSESSTEEHFIRREPKQRNENVINYYSLCSIPKVTEESICESVDSRGSFEEDSLNQSSDNSIELEEVCLNNKKYFVPAASNFGAGDYDYGDYVQKEKPCSEGRFFGLDTLSSTNRTDRPKNFPRIYSEETTTVVKVESLIKKSESSSSARFLSKNTNQNHSSQYSSQNVHRKSVCTSWSVERVQVSDNDKNSYEYSRVNQLNNVSFEKPNKANLSKLPQINKAKTKSHQKPEINEKQQFVVGDFSSQSSGYSSTLNSKFSSKLPVLQQKPIQTCQPVNNHWTHKHVHSKDQNNTPRKEVNKSSEYNKHYDNLRAFVKAPIDKDTDLFNFRRKLSPIAGSESVSCPKSFSSEQSSAYDNVNTSFAEELEETSDINCDRPYEIKLEQSQDRIGGDVFPERSTLLTFRVSKEKAFSNRMVLPDISVERHGRKEKCRHCGARSKQRMNFPNAVKKVVSRISTKKNNQFQPEPYNLYKSAEEQMLKLLEPEKEPPPKPVSEPKTPPTPISPSSFTSDLSAFTKFTPIQTPTPLFISEDHNANDRSSVDSKSRRSSEKSDSPLTITYSCDNRSRKDSNENPITLSTLSLCSSISIESVDSNKNGYRMALTTSAKAEKKTPVPLRRTVSAFESRKETPSRKASKGRDPSKGRLKMEDMLYGSSNIEGQRYFDSSAVSSFLDNDDHSSSNSLEKAVSDAETLNAEQELLKSMSEFEKIYCSTTSSPDQSSQPLKFPSLISSFPMEPTDRFPDIELQPAGHPGNGSDSAYSSLNRKSPVGGEGEGGARFCHECGAKYPLAVAKFCCQCGVRRLIL